MAEDIKMDGNQPAPAWFWLSLALIAVGSIILYVIFQHDKERNQLRMEKKISFYETSQLETTGYYL